MLGSMLFAVMCSSPARKAVPVLSPCFHGGVVGETCKGTRAFPCILGTDPVRGTYTVCVEHSKSHIECVHNAPRSINHFVSC